VWVVVEQEGDDKGGVEVFSRMNFFSFSLVELKKGGWLRRRVGGG